MTPEQQAMIQELSKRQDLTPEQRAMVSELQQRMQQGGGAATAQPVKVEVVEQPGFFRGMWDELPNLKQVFEGFAGAASRPLDTLGALSERQWDMLREADAAMNKGDVLLALRRAIEAAVPVLGPAMSGIGDEMGRNPTHAMGRATTQALMNVLPGNPLTRGGQRITPGMRNPNPVVSRAYDYLASRGVRIPAGVRTGNRQLTTIQQAAEQTYGGSRIAQQTGAHNTRALQAEAQRLASEAHPGAVTAQSVGEDVSSALQANSDAIARGLSQDADDIATRVHPQPQVPLQAGTDLRAAAEGRALHYEQQANTAYEPFHKAAQSAKNRRKVQVGHEVDAKTGKVRPVMELMDMPVYIGDIQQSLRPLVREWEMLVEPARRNSSRGFTAMKSILDWGKPWMPAELAEKALGGLKDLARTGKYENKGGEAFARAMRDENQGVASLALTKLQKNIDATVGKLGGADAVKGLQQGRQFTAQQYGVADDIVSKLQAEDVNAYGQMVYEGDSGVRFVQRVAQEIPDQMPKVGRAFWSELQKQIGTPAGWKSAKRQWDALGRETKQILYSDPNLRADIDAFFHQGVEFAETDIMREISREPVAVFGRLTAPEDVRIGFLQRVRDIAPQELPKVGRAYLEGLFDIARQEGGWIRSQGVLRAWQSLGAETKNLLFPNPMLRADLDNFFLGVKSMAERMNSSETAMTQVSLKEKGLWLALPASASASFVTGNPAPFVLNAVGAAGYSLGGRQLVKLLHSPQGTKLLLDGMRLPASDSKFAAVLTAKILEIAGEATDEQDKRAATRSK